MKIGSRIRRGGKRYEVLSLGRKSLRVRDLDSGLITRIPTFPDRSNSAKKGMSRKRSTTGCQKANVSGIAPTKEPASEAQGSNAPSLHIVQRDVQSQRLRREANELVENIEALRMLRDDHLRQIREREIAMLLMEENDLINIDDARMDKTTFQVASLFDGSGDRDFWKKKSPQERMAALELMRQIHYGYDPLTERLQRVLEIAERSPG